MNIINEDEDENEEENEGEGDNNGRGRERGSAGLRECLTGYAGREHFSLFISCF